MKENGQDPLAESRLAVDLRTGSAVNNAEPSQLKGLLLFVHGTPCDGKIKTTLQVISKHLHLSHKKVKYFYGF